MALTILTDLFSQSVVEDAVRAAIKAGMPALTALPGVAEIRGGLPNGRENVGSTINIPYFAGLGAYETISTDGDALTPVKLTSTAEQATVQHFGKAVQMTKLAQISGSGDPEAEVTKQLMQGFVHAIDDALIVAASANSGGAWDAYTNNVTSSVAFSWDGYVDSRAKFGDESDDIVGLAVHSATENYTMKIKDSTGMPLYVAPRDENAPARWAGKRLAVSDKLAPAVGLYNTLILKRNALVAWVDESAMRLVLEYDELTDSIIMAVHLYLIVHRYNKISGRTKPGVVHYKHGLA